MRFSLRSVLYATAHVSIALAAFGVLGIALSVMVIVFWAYLFKRESWQRPLDLAVSVMLLAFGVALLLPAIGSVREPARVRLCQANLRQITFALQAYHEANNIFPPAYLAGADGKPMHSWRMLILPHIESSSLFDQYDFDEPWDGPNNSKLISQMPYVYSCPSSRRSRGQTDYFIVTGSAAFPHGKQSARSDLGDGSLLLIESRVPNVTWTEPRDLTYEEALAALTSSASPPCHIDERFFTYNDVGFNIAVLDTSGVTVFGALSEDDARALLSADGLDLERLKASQERTRPLRLRWPRIISCSLLAVLSLWPLLVWWRNKPGTSE